MGQYSGSKERVMIVDEENRVIGSVTRGEMREQKLIHRASYVLVFNTEGRLFVHRRTASKDVYPGHWDVAAGGVVLAGETYEESARRELKEELGISGTDLKFLFDFFHSDENNRVWGRVFSCIHDGPMILQEEEVEEGRFMDMDLVFEMMKSQPFTPDGVMVLQRYLEMKA